ncbi:hypothetical protein [Virgibacillus sp. Bac332]|uniref:hypothetical protein n=1 Tax=Virgibacillus sp. Bac332 TaxID=2419842 RepID=UPI000EF52715|nr:hypothetical protein [Virgibacillus sp. Bac332]
MSNEHTYEHAWSCEKPSSESHTWSFKHACDACLQQIHAEHGIDYRVTDITFEDLGRETKTHVDWTGKRTWKCTHKVKATYKVEHRGSTETLADMEYFEETLNIKYKVKNVNYGI